MQGLLDAFPAKKLTDQSRTISVADIKNYDISAKNPSKIKVIEHTSPEEILKTIMENNQKILEETKKLEELLKD